jgi:hypothetical protein
MESGAGCVDAASRDEAVAICAMDGARLCSVVEMAAGCTSGTGCMHDADLIWTGSDCSPAPEYAYVINGNPNNGGVNNETTAQCAATSEEHEVRCCSDFPIAGYTNKEEACGYAVWSESNFQSAYGCVENVNMQEAMTVCAADGARLCSVAEMQAGCTAGTGCMHDLDLIWTGTECTTVPEYATVVVGNPWQAGANDDSGVACVASDTLHEVRCCSDSWLPGYANRFDNCGLTVWAESNFQSAYGCVHDATLELATAVCAADGARLCTVMELDYGCTVGTGCGHDTDLIWSDETCSP